MKPKSRAKVIAISGTPGVGKSTLAKYLQKHFLWRRLDLHHYYKQISTSYNQKKQCYDLDLKKVKKLVLKVRDEDSSPLIIDSHISHHLSPKIIDLCVVLTCSDLQKLKKRLQQRKYSTKKVRENLDAEIFQVCLTEAQENGHQLFVYDKITLKKMKLISQKIKLSLSSL